jgi:hypothetical protein
MVYAEALKRTVESRSGFWKRFHFIRSAAEQRDLKAMNEFLEEVKDVYPEMYDQAEAFAKEDVMTDVRREIKAAKNAILGKNQPSADVQRERESGNERRRDAAKGAQDKTRARKSAVPSSKVADDLFDDTAVKNETVGKIYDMIGKPTVGGDRFRMEAAKNELYPFMSGRIMEMWEKFNTAQEIDRDVVMDNQTRQLFGFVYQRVGVFGKDVKERLVITQKLCDMMMKRYSPAASDEKYEKYGESYAIDAIGTADLKKITGYEGSTVDLINDVKKDLARESVSVASEDEKAKVAHAKIADMKIEEKVLGSDMVNSK